MWRQGRRSVGWAAWWSCAGWGVVERGMEGYIYIYIYIASHLMPVTSQMGSAAPSHPPVTPPQARRGGDHYEMQRIR